MWDRDPVAMGSMIFFNLMFKIINLIGSYQTDLLVSFSPNPFGTSIMFPYRTQRGTFMAFQLGIGYEQVPIYNIQRSRSHQLISWLENTNLKLKLEYLESGSYFVSYKGARSRYSQTSESRMVCITDCMPYGNIEYRNNNQVTSVPHYKRISTSSLGKHFHEMRS